MAATQSQTFQPSSWIGRVATLAAGDLIALLTFTIIGRTSHAEAAGLNAILQVFETAAPFLAGWFITAPLVGAFRAELTARPLPMLGRTSLAWLIACPISLGLRALIRQSGIPITFAIISFVTVLVLLALWRTAFAAITSRRVASV